MSLTYDSGRDRYGGQLRRKSFPPQTRNLLEISEMRGTRKKVEVRASPPLSYDTLPFIQREDRRNKNNR